MEILREIRTSFNLTQDELAKKIMVEDRATIALYEGKTTPSMKVLVRLSEVFDLSIDYLVKGKRCDYPRNIKLLTLAKEFDNTAHSQSRSLIEASIDAFLKQKPEIEIMQDPLDLELKSDFHSNLKSIRSLNNISQSDLANTLNVGRTAITQYEMKNYPTLENLQKISSLFKISMHALVTGQKLNFQYKDGHFCTIMLLADKFLPLEKHKYLIDLMESILQK